ncbi:MAG: hypothetical protein RLZZ546_3034, partial [Bacteroidota bacterium]
MGNPIGFKNYQRELPSNRAIDLRINDYFEITNKVEKEFIEQQSSRCMDCGVPFCISGCPLGNLIPEFNDAVYHRKWDQAYKILSTTNNFPEFTGRVCPAPCEAACVLGINSNPVTIENIEKYIAEYAFEHNMISHKKNHSSTNKKIAIIGSGPSGLAAADQLISAGHMVVVYEKNDKPGGLLRYGIPDFKLEKKVVDRRIEVMKSNGVQFICNCNIGVDISLHEIESMYDAVLLCVGSTVPRDLPIEGRDTKGVYFAMDFLE